MKAKQVKSTKSKVQSTKTLRSEQLLKEAMFYKQAYESLLKASQAIKQLETLGFNISAPTQRQPTQKIDFTELIESGKAIAESGKAIAEKLKR